MLRIWVNFLDFFTWFKAGQSDQLPAIEQHVAHGHVHGEDVEEGKHTDGGLPVLHQVKSRVVQLSHVGDQVGVGEHHLKKVGNMHHDDHHHSSSPPWARLWCRSCKEEHRGRPRLEDRVRRADRQNRAAGRRERDWWWLPLPIQSPLLEILLKLL